MSSYPSAGRQEIQEHLDNFACVCEAEYYYAALVSLELTVTCADTSVSAFYVLG